MTAQTERLAVYEPDVHKLFCRHCGRSSFRHWPTRNGLECRDQIERGDHMKGQPDVE